MLKGTSAFTGVVTVLGVLQVFVVGLVGAHPRGQKDIILKRQFPDERTNLTVSTPSSPRSRLLTEHIHPLYKILPQKHSLNPSYTR